jgi:RimJ/RimL family protein N-acetyltransferase
MLAPFRRGHRVFLRAVEPADAPALVAWLNDQDNQQFTLGGVFPMNAPKEAAFIDRVMQSEKDLFVGLALAQPLAGLEAGTLVGAAGLHAIEWVHRFATFGILVGDARAKNQGLGTEATGLVLDHAFDVLNLERVELAVFDHNRRAEHVYRKLGFVEEGRRSKRCFKAGAWRDEILMVMPRGVWLERRAGLQP